MPEQRDARRRAQESGKGLVVLPPGSPLPPKRKVAKPGEAAKAKAAAEAALLHFRMPNAVKIAGRSSSITNSFANTLIPVIAPTAEEVAEALTILDMIDAPCCAYCGNAASEWDHLRPLIVEKVPTGYISEIHNLVPACGKCNQSKGNKHWQVWMFSTAKLSPASRGVAGLDQRAERLTAYEAWKAPTKLDFGKIVGNEAWAAYEEMRVEIIALMRQADLAAIPLREAIRAAYLAEQAD